MPQYQYSDILDYFRQIAISDTTLAHQPNGLCAFIASDISDQQIEQMQDLKSCFMIYGYNPLGIDSGRGLYRRPMESKPERIYTVPIALFKEQQEIDGIAGAASTIIDLDILSDRILDKVYDDRERYIFDRDPARCFLYYLSDETPISKGHIIGNRKAIGIVLYFTFTFCRTQP